MHKYIQMLDCEIERHIDHEKHRDGGLNLSVERDLHVLFENRKHALEWYKDHEKRKAEMERSMHAE